MARKIRPLALLILSLLYCTGNGRAWQSPALPATQSPDRGLATVYIYRLDDGAIVLGFFLGFLRKTRPVYFSESSNTGHRQKNRKIASLGNKQYFVLRLAPGKYVFDTRSMRGHLDLEVGAGGEYYLWVDQGNDCASDDPETFGSSTCESRNAAVIRVSPERWGKDMSVLKPIKSRDVKDRMLVIIPPGPPSNSRMLPTRNQEPAIEN